MIELKTKPSGIYYIDVEMPDDAGGLKRQRISLETRDPRNAEAQRRDWLVGLHPKHPAQGGSVAPKGRKAAPDTSGTRKVGHKGPTVHVWLTRCLSAPEVWGNRKAIRTHQSNVRVLSTLIDRDLAMSALTSKHIKDLERTMRDEIGYAPASVRKLLGSLSAACRFAEDEGVIATRPKFPSITVDNVQDRVVSLDEEEALFECIEKRRNEEPLRAWWHFGQLIALLLDTGFRLGEGLQSGPSSVKRKRWFDHSGAVQEGTWLALARGTTKNDKPRDVPCTARVLDRIKDLNDRATGGRWFPWNVGSSGPLYLLQNIRKDMAERGFAFDDVKLHTFRHTCATRLAEGGMDLVSLRDWLGHSDIKITAARYVHLMNGHIYRGAGILDAYAPGTMGEDTGKSSDDGANPSKPDIPANGGDYAKGVTLGSC